MTGRLGQAAHQTAPPSLCPDVPVVFLGARHTGGWGEERERELKLSRDFAQEQRRGMGAVL